MKLKRSTIVQPLPSEELLSRRQSEWELTLPEDYKDFLLRCSGAEPVEKAFSCNGETYVIDRFLCVLEDTDDTGDEGWYDIDVVESQIGERLTANEDLVGIEVLPIAKVEYEDYLCLDFRTNPQAPTVCLWINDESGEFDPVTYPVAENFTAFTRMLHS